MICIDTDQLNQNPVQAKEFEEIKEYANQNNYNLVWFNIDIEDVFLGRVVSNELKVNEAANFQRNKGIRRVKKELLRRTIETSKGSNIMLILSELLGNEKMVLILFD